MRDLIPQIHPVDREAVLVWFALRERWDASRLVDASHGFLYGHRYWPRVRRVLLTLELRGHLAEDARRVAEAATRTTRVDHDQLLGIAAVGVAILTLVGREPLEAGSGDVALPEAARLETPGMVLRRRTRRDPEGWFGRFRGASRRWMTTVEPDPSATRVVTHGGPLLPCRGASHAHCHVGVLSGADRLSPAEGMELHPLIRTGCEARVYGRVSYVPLAGLLAPA